MDAVSRGQSCRRDISVLSALFVLASYGASVPLRSSLPSPFQLHEDGAALLEYLARQPSGTVVANEVTTGAFHVIAGQSALLEGHQPVLRPSMITRTLKLREAAEEFFTNPQKHVEFINENQIRYIVVAPDRSVLGGTPLDRNSEINVNESAEWALPQGWCLRKQFGGIELYVRCF